MPCRSLRAGKLGDARLDLPGDPRLPSRRGPWLALQGFDRPDLAAALAEALDGADAKSGDFVDFNVLFCGAVKPFVTKEQGHGRHGLGSLGSLGGLLIANGFEFFPLGF